MPSLGSTDLDVFPLCLGGNVFGWTADRDTSFEVLDAYAAAGGNFIDTADSYAPWGSGRRGDSEAIIGEWMQSRGNRDQMIIATKVARAAGLEGLAADNIRKAAAESLERLRTDRIDLYFAHTDDDSVPLEESLGAFDELVRAGKVRHVGVSDFSPARLDEALAVSKREGFASFAAVQDLYNLMDRGYEGPLRETVQSHGLPFMPFFGLASGFLTGKYRPGGPAVDSQRAPMVEKYVDDPRAARLLSALDEVAATHAATISSVSLVWLAAKPTVATPIASARTADQLKDLLPMTELELSSDEIEKLDAASAPAAAAS